MMRLTTLFSLCFLSVAFAFAGPRHYSSNIEGDVNADGDVNIADINVVTDAILSELHDAKCDVNGDGDINIADLNYLFDLILTGPVKPTVTTGMYMGLIGYNQTLETKEISLLDSITVSDFNSFVAGLTTQQGRLLYYSVDKALDALNAAKYPQNLQNVAVVTFTKGLDQGSLMMTDQYDTEAQYAQALNARIADQRVYGRAIKAYTVGLLNPTIVDENQFRANLYALASDSTKAMEANNMEDVNASFNAIADDLVARNMSENLTLVFPGVGTGTRIRFTLDDVNEETVNDSQVYIEGTFSLKTRSLTGVTYQGMTCNAGDSVAATSVDGMFVSLLFTGIQLDSEDTIQKEKIQEWYWVEDQNTWALSTEFSVDRLPEVQSTYSSALVMLLLDCSSVLDENFGELQTAADKFIERMQNYATVIPEPEPIPGLYTVNGVSFKMIDVEGGTFTMGVDSAVVYTGEANIDEMPAHEVTVSSFAIGQTEVTQELWQAVMGTNPSHFADDPQRPVEQVSWEDCQEFIARLNELTGENFRLPTEAEWEYAARGGNQTAGSIFSGSDNIDEVAWFYFNSDYATRPVAGKGDNELNLFDMCGNVSEWCSDWYGTYPTEPQVNPVGPVEGSRRVFRGGNWRSISRDCRNTSRAFDALNMGSDEVGLRLAL
jgi:formylglycine-generating enzyme required for sulfatase activity